MDAPPEAPSVAVPVYAEVWDLELGAALTVFRLCGGAGAAHTVARSRASVLGAGGLVTTPQYIYAALPEPAAVFVPGGPGAARAAREPALREFLRDQAARGVGLAACGSGLILLGEAGLLRGHSLAVTPELENAVWGYDPAAVRPGGWTRDRQLVTARGGLGAVSAALAVAAAVWGEAAATEAAHRLDAPWP